MAFRRGMISILAAFAFLFTVFAGCTNAPAKSCPSGPACDSATGSRAPTNASPLTTPGGNGSLMQPEGANQTVQFEGCQGGVGSLEVPPEWAASVVPDAFDAVGLTPNTATYLFEAIQCTRIVANNTVFPDAYYFNGEVTVQPKNESWSDRHIHRYVLDAAASSEPLAKFLAPFAVPVKAATFTRTIAPAGSGPAVDQWQVAGPDCTFTFGFQTSGEPNIEASDLYWDWVGTKPFHRIENHKTLHEDKYLLGGSPLLVEGNCRSETAAQRANAQTSQAIPQFAMTWIIPGKEYD